MEVLSLARKAELPVDTFALAALILRPLGARFYVEWHNCISCLGINEKRTKEVVIVAALVCPALLLANSRLSLKNSCTMRFIT